MQSDEIEKLTFEDYLYPEKFALRYDNTISGGEYRLKQYQKGFDTGLKSNLIYIAVNSVWSARMKNGSHLQSYERIGYHLCTDALLQGFLDSGCKIHVSRIIYGEVITREIK